LDICNNRILHHEISTIPTIRSTTKRELSTYPTSSTTHNANDQKSRDLMTDEISAERDSDRKRFIREHWGIVALEHLFKGV
jgi:hypothetical protein